jgi:hypothetical protein
MTGNQDPQSFLREYIVSRGVPVPSEGVPDIPDFVVDQRYQPLRQPSYPT